MATIEFQNVSVEFPVYNISSRSFKKQFLRLATGGGVAYDAKKNIVVRALSNINLSLQQGDRVGIIGHNGAGKSTLLKLLAKIYEPTHGQLTIDGSISPMLELMHGIEPELTGNENIVTRGLLLGLSHKQITQQLDTIASFTGLGDYLAMPVRTYSSGMMVRLAFAISTNIKPDILLIDEVFSAGDAAFIEKARIKMSSLLNQSNILVMANHSTEIIREFCNKALLLTGGEVTYFGSVDEALAIYYAT